MEQRALAKAVFGRPARVLLAAWIWERGSEPFVQNEAGIELASRGEAYSAVVDELKKFAEWGLVTRSGPSASQRSVMYAANKEHPLWEVFRAARGVFGLAPNDR